MSKISILILSEWKNQIKNVVNASIIILIEKNKKFSYTQLYTTTKVYVYTNILDIKEL